MSEQKKRSNQAGGGAPQKKSRGFYQQMGKPSADKAIPNGAVGIFITCDAGRERKATDELIHLVEEAFTRLGKEHVGRSKQPAAAAAAAAAGDGGSKSSSVDALLAAEVAQLKDKRKDRFKRYEPGVRGTSFLEFPKAEDCPTPEEVAVNIAQHVKDTQSLPARHLMRLLPVSQTCFVSTEDVTALAAKVAELHFPSGEGAEGVAFAVDFEHRACDKLKRNDVIKIIATAVPQPPHKVNLNAPKKTIIVQLVRNVCAVSVVAGYKELMRLNVRKLAETEEEAEAAGDSGKDAAAEPQQQGAAAAEQQEAADGEEDKAADKL